MTDIHPKWIIALLLTTWFAACTSDRSVPGPRPAAGPAPASKAAPAAPESGGYSLRLVPENPTRHTVLQLTTGGFSASDVKILWAVDGSVVSSDLGGRFDCAATPRGSVISAVALVNGIEVKSNSVTVANTAPELQDAVLHQNDLRPGETLWVEASASDIDNDPVTILYAWSVNGAFAGNGQKLGRQVKRGDFVRIEVRPFDGQLVGQSVELKQIIANWPPVFNEHQNVVFDGRNASYQPQVTDPDGDRITFSLESSEPGLSIQPATGLVVWTVPDDFRGEKQVTIIADDGQGGSTRYSITFLIR